MSGLINDIIAKPMGVDVLSQLQNWQALRQAQAQTGLTQAQTQGAQIGNQLQGLNLARTNWAYGLAGLPTGVPSGPTGALPAPTGAPPPAAQASALPTDSPSAGALTGLTGQPGAPPAPASAAGSLGPRWPGQAAYEMWGVPINNYDFAMALSSPDPQKAKAEAIENRRVSVYSLANVPPEQYPNSMITAFRAGLIPPETLSAAVNNPQAAQQRMLDTYKDPESHASAMTAMSNAGIQTNPATNQSMVSPVALAAKRGVAQAEAGGKSAGDLPLAGPLAAARAQGSATADTTTIPQPVLNADGTPKLDASGNPMVQNVIVNKAKLAAAAGGGAPSIPAAPSSDGIAGNPLLGPIPPNMVPGGAPTLTPGTPPAWGQSAPDVPSAANSSLAPQAGAAPNAPPTSPVGGIATGVPVQTPAQAAGLGVTQSAISDDQKEVAGSVSKAEGAQQAQAQLLNLRSLGGQINAGSFAGARQGVQNYLATFAPDSAQRFVSALTAGNIDPSKAVATQEFVKLSLQNAGSAERDTLGARGGYGAIQLYQKSFPNIETQPQAIRDMTNLLLVAHQRDVDYGQGVNQFFQGQRQGFENGSGKYQSTQSFDQNFMTANPPQVYVAAAGALNDQPYSKWSRGMTPEQQQQALRIMWRADPSAQPLGVDGKTRFLNPALGGQ